MDHLLNTYHFIPTIIIAKNQGTNYTYYLQLVLPYVIILGVTGIYNSRLCPKESINPYLINTILIILTIISIVSSQKYLISKPYTSDDIIEWEKCYGEINKYCVEGDVLLPIVLSDYCIKNQLITSEYGQAVYNNQNNLDHYKNNTIYRKDFKISINTSIELGLQTLDEGERSNRITEAMMKVDLASGYARIAEKRRIKQAIEDAFIGTEHEDSAREIALYFCDHNTETGFRLYNRTVHKFGKKDGNEIFHILKRVI